MKSVQEIYNHIAEISRDQKTFVSAYKDALKDTDKYEDIENEIKILQEKKRQIELLIKRQLGKNYEKIEELKEELKTAKESLSEVSLITLMSEKEVKVEDENGKICNPVWSVKFKKGKQQKLFNDQI